MQTDESFILVPGGAGYIGSVTCKYLKLAGFTPIVYDNLSTGNKDAVKWGPFESGDIKDKTKLSSVITKYKPIAVMHFAASIAAGESVNKPREYYDNNLLGTKSLLDVMLDHDIKNIVFSSTAAVYGNPVKLPIDEDHPLNPINPYGSSKLMIEQILKDYSHSYGLKFAALRYFNAAGADLELETGCQHEKPNNLIPIIMQVLSGHIKKLQIYGNDYKTEDGTAIRDYIHVVDLAKAHILALDHLLNDHGNLTLNLGTSIGNSVKEVVDNVESITQHSINYSYEDRREGDAAILVANANKASEILNWQAKHSDIKTIIDSAWQWHKKLHNIT